MENKIWNKTVIAMGEQDVEIYPTEMFDGIIVEVKELNGAKSERLYLDENEMNILVQKMQEMMKYVKE